MRPDELIARHARAQHGVFTRKQAIAARLGENAIRHRLATGTWIALCPGIYAVASAATTWERQLTAAILSRPGSVAAGQSAAYLHRFPGFQPARPVIMAPADTNARLSVGRVIRANDFDQIATTIARGFPSTSVAETLWTIARSTTDETLSSLIDQLVSMGRTDPERLREVLTRVAGTRQRGLARFRRAVGSVVPDAYSTAANVLEALLYQLLSDEAIPSVSRQHEFLLGEPSRVDAYIAAWRLVVEADGRNWHTRQADFQRDRERDNHLATKGILVVRFTYDDLTRRFDECLRTLIETGHHRRVTNVV